MFISQNQPERKVTAKESRPNPKDRLVRTRSLFSGGGLGKVLRTLCMWAFDQIIASSGCQACIVYDKEKLSPHNKVLFLNLIV